MRLRTSVRELVAFSEQRGDINFRFTSRSSAIAGVRGHQRLQRKRGEDYVAEQPVTDTASKGGLELTISGRADGYFPATDPLIVDEIKTVRGDASLIPDSVTRFHRGQARVYAWLLGKSEGASAVTVRVCYLQLDDDSEVILEETMGLDALGRWYASLVDRFLDREIERQARRRHRDATIEALDVPYGGFRSGQREMAVSVWRTLRDGGEAVIQAPTGIGKTMASMYPAVRALASLDYDKVFFLTAKGSGQIAAREAIADMRSDGLAVSDITLIAKEKACFNPGVPCHPEQCAYAAGYYDRLPDVLAEHAGATQSFSPEYVSRLAEDKGMCPFELSLDLARIADVVIADYNYAFDPWVHLKRFFDDSGGKYAFLVDEAHNLVDRGRDMFSASLDKRRILAARRALKDTSPGVARRLGAINDAILELRRDHREVLEANGYVLVDEFPARLVKAMRRFCESAEEWLTDRADEALLDLYFDVSRFLKTLDLVDDDYRCFLEETDGKAVLRVLAANPSRGLRSGFERAAASVSFSGTLSPQPYFRRLIGVGEEAAWLRVRAPFPQENLGVFVTTWLSTAWRDRRESLDGLVDTIAAAIACKQGNYLVFFPSYRYLMDASERFRERHPDVDCMAQSASMDAAEREAFLGRFRCRSDRTLLGFAVTGGVFGEGVDLQGDELIGVLIAGVGLPGLSTERDLIGDHFATDGDRESGFRYAYQYPGINRVLQTAGRVIRSAADRGIVCLIDNRFADSRYAELLPADWRVALAPSQAVLASAINAFWNGDGENACRPGNPPDSPLDSRGRRRSSDP